ncbi:MAG: SIS domain-containing protein [Candidatus Omnitrophica bacterium]|nr:SIS domain-containing protein [Candidatus Omnitrophota bacterium]MCM8831042.1 SIS domain-containing protein [Candidatus Omnitrophota bacterium]
MKEDYFKNLADLFYSIAVSKGTKNIEFDLAIKIVSDKINSLRSPNKIILIGNGGSSSIASHIATDFLKNINKIAIVFSDASLLTCLANDLGYENIFYKPIATVANKNDILFSISSSGKSKNIILATNEAKRKGCFIVTFSGFSPFNQLRKLGDINFYIPSNCYGFVEILHLAICHYIVDILKK